MQQQDKTMFSLGAGIILVVAGFLYGLAGLTTVQPGEYSILIKQFGEGKGVQEQGLSVGTHWIEPISYDVVTYDTRAKQYAIKVEATTKDGQPVVVGMTLEISLEHGMVKDLHQLIGRDYFERVVFPAATSSITDSLPTQLSDEVYTDDGRSFIRNTIVQSFVDKQIDSRGINISLNLQSIDFTNEGFVSVLEEKAKSAQLEEIERRRALAAEQEAIKIANVAEGAKQKRIKEAEAEKETLRLEGEGERIKQEEIAKGILATRLAEAEGQAALVAAFSGKGSEAVVALSWAENLGPNVKVYGVPTGAPGTTTVADLNGVLQGALGGMTKK